MSLKQTLKMAKLGLRLKSMWTGISKKNPITPRKIVDTMKIIWQFLGGSLAVGGILAGSWYFDPCGLREPTQVLAAPSYRFVEPRPEISLLTATRIEHEVHDYDVRIEVHGTQFISYGSGTLFRPDAIATCYHLFDDATKGTVVVTFPDGNKVHGRLWKGDKTHDVACVVIAPVVYIPAKVSGSKNLDGLEIRGYPGDKFVSKHGPFVRWYRPTKESSSANSACIDVGVQSGTSGGGIFNDDGLYGIVWGSIDDQTYGTSGAGFRSFIKQWNEQLDARPNRLVVVTDPSICQPCATMEPTLFRLIGEGYQIECRKPQPGEGMIPKLLFYRGENLLYTRQGVVGYNDLTIYLRKPVSE